MVDPEKQRLYTIQHLLFIIQMYVITTDKESQDEHLSAIFTEHLPKKEFNIIPMNVVLLGLSIFVVVGRWILIS